jgi:FkbM family methyltransferase
MAIDGPSVVLGMTIAATLVATAAYFAGLHTRSGQQRTSQGGFVWAAAGVIGLLMVVLVLVHYSSSYGRGEDDPRAAACVWAKAKVLAHSWDMCTYPDQADRYVSRGIQQLGCFECGMVAFMLRALGSHDNSMLIDRGANVGMYTTAAAAANHSVLAFEPVPDNAARIVASTRRNRMMQSRVRLVTTCVGDETSLCQLGASSTNQGGPSHRTSLSLGPSSATLPPTGGLSAGSLVLDSILGRGEEAWSPAVFLKLDIQGAECAAFRGMRQFLERRVRVVSGMAIELSELKHCCHELVRTGGAFATLTKRHGLCAYDATNFTASGERKVAAVPIPLGAICTRRRGNLMHHDLLWQPCGTAPGV